ncbi:DNA-binding protein [Plebeiibacterium sediminum]|uniref:DNA-binding protein n=1 Tax=Plebeiibacterium sediminum TaxID=2992112 RepID=A0AAE3M1E4_9BACT|nr:DNA-binding protein [Plebeiobacterium sediminum]MCW3785348.1 DNA-binding protein [Plebeiobacterium sediminum]
MSTTTITFNQLRKLKDSLPNGSMRTIAEDLDLNVETVRNYFGGKNYDRGKCVGIHIEPGPDGGIVELDDTTILEYAKDLLEGKKQVHEYKN